MKMHRLPGHFLLMDRRRQGGQADKARAQITFPTVSQQGQPVRFRSLGVLHVRFLTSGASCAAVETNATSMPKLK